MINILFSVILINWKNQTLGFSDCFENVIRFWYLQRTVNSTWTYQFKRKWRREDLVLALDLLVFSRWNNVKNGWELCYAEWRSNSCDVGKLQSTEGKKGRTAICDRRERDRKGESEEIHSEREWERGGQRKRKKEIVSEWRERERAKKERKKVRGEGGRKTERERVKRDI